MGVSTAQQIKPTPIVLRDYQKTTVDEIYRLFAGRDPRYTEDGETAQCRRVCLVAPTGSGKTKTALKMVLDCAAKGRRVWFIVTINTLVYQTAAALREAGITDYGVVCAGQKEYPDRVIQIVSLQTLARRREWLEIPPHLAIFDEAHTSAWYGAASDVIDKTLTSFTRGVGPNADGTARPGIVLGLTATPFRLKRTESFRDRFGAVVFAPRMSELTEKGSLAPLLYKGFEAPDLQDVRSSMGDFRTDDLSLICDTDDAIGSALDAWEQHGFGKRSIAFTVSVAHAESVAKLFNLRFNHLGLRAIVVTGETKLADRQTYFAAIAAGPGTPGGCTMLVSCAALSTGFDVPAIEVGLLMRPTKSFAVHMQQIGRVARPSASTRKTTGLILDMAGNVSRLGFPEDLSEAMSWETVLFPARTAGTGPPPTRNCPECASIERASAKRCGQCDFEFPLNSHRLEAIGQVVDLRRSKTKAPIDTSNWVEADYRNYYRGLRMQTWTRGQIITTAYAMYAAKKFPSPFDMPKREWCYGSLFGDKPTKENGAAFYSRLLQWQEAKQKDHGWMLNRFSEEFGRVMSFSTAKAEYEQNSGAKVV